MKVCVSKLVPWDYVNPAPLNQKMLLLTKDNQCVIGPWKGDPIGNNKTYKAWCGMPDRDKEVERTLGYL